MNTPLVSVIVPARNAERFIDACLSSVRKQSHQNLEIFVIDDGSEDNTASVTQSVDDERIQLLQTDGIGAAAARNRGVEAASGQYLQFLDADDCLSPDKIRNQLQHLARADNAIASCAWGHFKDSIDQTVVSPQPVWHETDPVCWLQQSLAGEGMMQTACWLVPRAIAEDAGPWNEELSLHDDGEYFARVLMSCNQQIFVNDAIVYYRTVESSLSRTRSRKAAESAFAVCESRDKLLLGLDGSEDSKIAVATSYAQFAYEFSRAHRDLAINAIHRVKALDVAPAAVIGDRFFRLLADTLGFAAAMKIRTVVNW